MKQNTRLLLGAGMALALSACSSTGGEGVKSVSVAEVISVPDAPFPSTYKPYPGIPTALVGATVYDGTGKQIDNGVVLFRDGKVEAVGAGLSTQGYSVTDGTGKFVTPGVIDIHSHLGDYPNPSVDAHSEIRQ